MLKKIIKIFCVIMLFSFICLMPTNVKAEDNIQMIITQGCGKFETMADYCVINFNINVTAEEFNNGQKKINEYIDNISNKVKDLNSENSLYVTYSSCYPSYKDALCVYNFSCSFSVKNIDIEKNDDIIQIVGESGVVSYYGIDYHLNNEKELYSNALALAKEDAISQANALLNNAKLKAIISTNIYSYCGEKDNMITIEARIKAVFVANESVNEESSNKTTTKEIYSNKAYC